MSLSDLLAAYASAELARQEYRRACNQLESARCAGDGAAVAALATRVVQLGLRAEEFVAAAERSLWVALGGVRLPLPAAATIH